MVWLAPTRLRPLHYQALVSRYQALAIRYQALAIRYQALVVRRSQPRHQSETKPQNRKIGHWHTNSARMCSKNAAPPISAAWDLQSHTIEYQDFQSEKNTPLICLSHVFSESPCGLADSEIRTPIAPDYKTVAAYQRCRPNGRSPSRVCRNGIYQCHKLGF